MLTETPRAGFVATVCLLVVAFLTGLLGEAQAAEDRLRLREVVDSQTRARTLRGAFRVPENRETRAGRRIDLHLVVLKATGPDPRPDPVFVLQGGPGGAATSLASGFVSHWMRKDRDIVLVDQRGTGRSNPLHVRLPGRDDNLQGYLDPLFQPRPFAAALSRLRKIADLAWYTTPVAVDDLDEVRAALGYGKINVMGGSYGTRAALEYLRRHPEGARAAVLIGVAPVSFVNPLYHAQAAQEGLERIFAEVEGDPAYRAAFPDLRSRFEAILARLEVEPAQVTVRHPATGGRVEVRLTREAFAEALRIQMYFMDTNRKVPLLLRRAFEGDLAPFAETGIAANRRIRNMLAFGMLMCVTGSEDLPRIDPESIPRLTERTFLGDGRVRRQMRVGAFWPRGRVPADYGDPVTADVPVLLISGTHDPVTPPGWGEAAARHLSNSLHLVVPGAHGIRSPQTDMVIRDFLARGSVEGLDTSPAEKMRMPRFEMPGGAK